MNDIGLLLPSLRQATRHPHDALTWAGLQARRPSDPPIGPIAISSTMMQLRTRHGRGLASIAAAMTLAALMLLPAWSGSSTASGPIGASRP